MDKIELKPCPFCGEDPQVIRIKGKDGWRDRFTVRCPYDHGGCGAEGGMYHYEEEAVEAWNKRYSDQNAEPGKKYWLDQILRAGLEGREVEFRIGGRLFAIREKAQ